MSTQIYKFFSYEKIKIFIFCDAKIIISHLDLAQLPLAYLLHGPRM